MRAPLRRALFMALLAVLLIGGLAWAFWPQPVPVDLATIERGPLRVTVDGEGQTRVRDVYVVSAPLAGRGPPGLDELRSPIRQANSANSQPA